MKIKPLTKEQILISIDRLTRFKEPEIKYLRVFKDIILSNLIDPKFKKTDLENMKCEEIKNYAEQIINYSVNSRDFDIFINKKLFEYEESVFYLSENAKILINNKIDYKNIIKILPENLPENLKFLKSLSDNSNFKGIFPIKKIVLCEGITEEILLPEFAKICGANFEKYGIYILSAGGKNQVVKYYYNYAEILKIPIFILLDNDAVDNINQIMPKLRNTDKIHLVKSGEFEDLLTNKLIEKTLSFETKNISLPTAENIDDYPSKAEFLENYFKNRGLHEFKKADFALDVKENISDITDISSEIKEIIEEIFKL